MPGLLTWSRSFRGRAVETSSGNTPSQSKQKTITVRKLALSALSLKRGAENAPRKSAAGALGLHNRDNPQICWVRDERLSCLR